ncbi:hypothetical protein RFI_23598, partial [Reticulomyxa filosa]
MGGSPGHQRVSEIFSFVQMEMTTRLQDWMERSLLRTGQAIERAAKTETWESPTTRTLDKQVAEKDERKTGQGRNANAGADVDDDEHKITWADFVTDSFVFIDNEINAYFVNIKAFPPEAMVTATQFYEHLFLLIQYILKIIDSAFDEFE